MIILDTTLQGKLLSLSAHVVVSPCLRKNLTLDCNISLHRQQGVRIVTFYLYLNDVEAGGGTNFNQLNITVMPKVGRAVLWPSVLDEDPNKRDDRTHHQALPVEAGIKYGANAWFHLRDFKDPYHNNCI